MIYIVHALKNGRHTDDYKILIVNTRTVTNIDQLREKVGREFGFGDQWSQFVHHLFTAEGIQLTDCSLIVRDRQVLYYASTAEEEFIPPGQPEVVAVESDSDDSSEVSSDDGVSSVINSVANPRFNSGVNQNQNNNIDEFRRLISERVNSIRQRAVPIRSNSERAAPYQVPNRNSSWNVRLPSAAPIKLNVGGTVFETTYATLSRRAPTSKLARMFDPLNLEHGMDRPLRNSTSGEYFVDRDPKYFGPLLNYLRTGSLVMDKELDPAGVFNEAVFFEIEACIPPGWQTRDISVEQAMAYFAVVGLRRE